MKKIYHLASCSTCKRILGELGGGQNFELQNIKLMPISAEELDFLKSKTGSFESLFSRKSLKFRALGLHDRILSETDYRDFILSEYTFLKRPVVVNGEEIFVGNLPKTVEAAKKSLGIL
jgi:arsenate reductase (glutaredoxin)